MSDKAVTNQAMSVETVGQVLKAAEALDKERGLMNPRYAVMLARDLLAAQARIGELEATIAMVNDLCQALFIEADDMMADVSKHAKASALMEVRMRIESALATPGKAT